MMQKARYCQTSYAILEKQPYKRSLMMRKSLVAFITLFLLTAPSYALFDEIGGSALAVSDDVIVGFLNNDKLATTKVLRSIIPGKNDQAIVDNIRSYAKNPSFKSVRDLSKVEGISDSLANTIKSEVKEYLEKHPEILEEVTESLSKHTSSFGF